MRSASLLLVIACLVGCSGGEATAEGGNGTSSAEAKQTLDKNLSQEQQTELAAKVKAWDPKKDKK